MPVTPTDPYMPNPIIDGGLIDDIMTAIGLLTDFDITNVYSFCMLYLVYRYQLYLLLSLLFCCCVVYHRYLRVLDYD